MGESGGECCAGVMERGKVGDVYCCGEERLRAWGSRRREGSGDEYVGKDDEEEGGEEGERAHFVG